jgi:hypothetical protein
MEPDMALSAEQTQLILDGDLTALVFGLGENFALFHDTEDLDEAVERGHIAGLCGYRFCGVLSLRAGRPAVSLARDNPMAPLTLVFAALEFLKTHRDYLLAHQDAAVADSADSSDSAEWLTRLFALPDTRV